jgi:hypothetical protein
MEGPTEKCFEVLNKSFCGFCRHYHKIGCMAESFESLKLHAFYQRFFDAPISPNCFEPNPNFERLPSRYVINLFEHQTAEQTLMEAFKALENSKRLPKHIGFVHAEYKWVRRQRYIYVEVGVSTPKDLSSITNMKVKAYFYFRNITGREIFSRDIPKLFRMSLPKDDLNRYILVAPQLPPSKADKFYRDIERLKVTVWEIYKAFKVEGNRSKWIRRIAKKLQEVEHPKQLAEALASRVLNFLRACIKPFLQLLRRLYPQTAELVVNSIETWWIEGLDVEKIFAKDRGPPNERDKPIGFIKAYTCKMR